jgi:RHS repeat-associated protein
MSNETVTKSSRFYCVSLTPDICKTPVGSSTPPLPYTVVGEFADAQNASPNVKSHSEAVILHRRSTIPTVKGDAAGRAGGVKSGTTGKQVDTKTASSAHHANGADLVQVGREVWMNARNTVGKIYERGGERARPTLKPLRAQILDALDLEARLKTAAQVYKDKFSEELHGAGARLADTGGTVMSAGAVVGVAGVAVAATGVGAPVAAVMEAGALAGGIAGGAAVAGGTVLEASATVLDRTANFVLTGEMPDLAEAAMHIGANAAESAAQALVTSKVPGGKLLGKWLEKKLSPYAERLKKKVLGEKPPNNSGREPPKPPSNGGGDDGKSRGKKNEAKSDAPSGCCPQDTGPARKPVSSGKPVHFGTGQEVLYQTDFVLDGPLPIVWTRCYRSGAECGDWGPFGARWASAFTTSLSLLEAGIIYHDDSGRALRLPYLAPGQSHDSRKEGFVLTRGDGDFKLAWRDGSVDSFTRAGAAWLPHGYDGVNAMLAPAAPVGAERYVLVRSAGRDGRGISIEHRPDAAPGDVLLRIRDDDGEVVEAMRETQRDAPKTSALPGAPPPPRIARVEQVLEDGTRICHAVYHYEAEPPQRGADGKEVAAPSGQPVRRYNLVRQTNLLGDARSYAYRHHLLSSCTSYAGFAHTIEWLSLEALRARWAGSPLDDAQLAARHPITLDNSYRARATATRAADGSEGVEIDYVDGDTTRVSENGGVLEYVFDANWLATDVRRVANGAATSLGRREWDRDGMLLAEIDANGRSHYGYDAAGNLSDVTDPAGHRSSIAYDAHNQAVALTDALGNVSRRSYDKAGRLATATDALGHVTTYRYDDKGRLAELTDAKGGGKRFLYDAAGRVDHYTDCSGHTTRYSYDTAGRLSKIRDAEGAETFYEHDAVGRLVRLTQPDGAQERFDFDADGNLLVYTDANGNQTRYRHNGQGLPVERIDANGNALGYRYDAGLQLVELLNGNGESYRFTYHVEGWLESETGFDGKVTRYGYDKAGQLIASECAGLRTDYVRDQRGLLCLKTTADGMVRYAHDALGRMTAVSASQSELRFRYDALGQLTEERTACFLATLPVQAVPPNSARVAAASFVTTHAYDELGNRIQTVLPNGRRVDTLRYGSGHWHGTLWQGAPVADLERDRLHRERQRRYGGGAQLQATRAYDPQSRLAAMTLGRGGGKQDDPKLRERRFSYDPVGNLVSIEHGWHTPNDTLGRSSYTYDPLGQLLTAVQPGLTEIFAFDPAGNMLDAAPETDGPDAAKPAAVAHNLLKSYHGAHYDYDGQGNAISKRVKRVDGAYDLDLAYDAENRLVRAVRTTGTRRDSARYFYDPFGRRIAKQVTEERWGYDRRSDAVAPEHTARHTTLFVWDGDALAQEVRQDKTVTYLYEPDSFVPLARIESEGGHGGALGKVEEGGAVPDVGPGRAVHMWYVDQWALPSARQGPARQAATQADVRAEEDHQIAWRQRLLGADNAAPRDRIDYYNCDHLGTPRELVDGQGRVVWSARYKAWGRVVSGGGWTAIEASVREVEQALRFQGQYHDNETGLHYNRFRYYDPDTARYLSQDPISLAGGTNLYQYANNPVRWSDPLGLVAAIPAVITWIEITGKTRTEIRELAKQKGLIPIKVDAAGESIKWNCSCTGKERLRLDRGHVDKETGLQYNDKKAAVDHVHGYDSTGKVKIVSPVDGNPHFPTKGE